MAILVGGRPTQGGKSAGKAGGFSRWDRENGQCVTDRQLVKKLYHCLLLYLRHIAGVPVSLYGRSARSADTDASQAPSSSVTETPSGATTETPWSNWTYQVYPDNSQSKYPCILASFRLSFAAEYPAMKNSKDILATGSGEMPPVPDAVEGQCGGSWGQLLRVSWQGGNYLLELKFSKARVHWYLKHVAFTYNIHDNEAFPNAANNLNAVQTSTTDSVHLETTLGNYFSCSETSVMLRNTKDQSYKMALKFQDLKLFPIFSQKTFAKGGGISSARSEECIQDELPPFAPVNPNTSVTVAALCAICTLVVLTCFFVYRRIQHHLGGYHNFPSSDHF